MTAADEVDALLRELDATAHEMRGGFRGELYARAADEISRLRAEVAEWRSKATEWNDPLGAASLSSQELKQERARADAAEARCAGLERDAARYRCVRDLMRLGKHGEWVAIIGGRHAPESHKLSFDRHIDAQTTADDAFAIARRIAARKMEATAATPDTLTTGPAQAGAAGSAATKGERKG